MRIAVAASEVVPFAKTGGLADVAGALPKALSGLGHEVVVVMPRYKSVDMDRFGLKLTGKAVNCPMADKKVRAEIYEGALGGKVRAYFLDMPDYYRRDNLYGTPQGDYPDNAERFMFFCKAIPKLLKAVGFAPDVIHLNDWQTGLVPAYLREFYRDDPELSGAATLYTVHNLGYQGQFWPLDMPLTGLGWEYFSVDGFEFYGNINMMKAGLVFADVINTVSKTYAREIQTPENGHGMEGVLRARAGDLFGIVNGIDYEEWDPENDKAIHQRFGPGDMKGKQANKRALKKELGLGQGNKPLLGMITRLADQKGLDILSEAMPEILGLGAQLVLLGTGDQKYHDIFSELARSHPKDVSVTLGFDAGLARRIYAGSDVFLMPSRYEPCGLGQLISLRYGTVPLVRKTGGLADTVANYSAKTGRGNGFVFSEHTARALVRAARAALGAYSDKEAWAGLVGRGMAEDHSWERSAKEYVKLYQKALHKRATAGARAA